MNIKITVRNKLPICGDVAIVCDNRDYTVIWELGEEWSGYGTKTMRTTFSDGTHVDTVFTGTKVNLPVVTVPGRVCIGLYAGDIHTSAPACITAKPSILSCGGTPAKPSEDVYNQLMDRMAQLETPDWNQNDPDAKDYVKNRPGGYTKITPGYDITWDGVVGDKSSVEYDGVRFVKVSDRALTAEELLGATVVVDNGGDEELSVYTVGTQSMWNSGFLTAIYIDGRYDDVDLIVSVSSAPAYYDSDDECVFEETGTYFAWVNESDADDAQNFFTTSLSKAEESHVIVKIPGEITGMVGGYDILGLSSILLDETISKERFVEGPNGDWWDTEVTIALQDCDYVRGTVNGDVVFGRYDDESVELYPDGDNSVVMASVEFDDVSNKYTFTLYEEPTTDCEVHLTQYTCAKPVTIPRTYIEEGFVSEVYSAARAAYDALNRANAAATKANPVFTGTFSQNRKAGSAVGDYSHAEGQNTTASAKCSHTEGSDTVANGNYSHAEGMNTTASGLYSHAEGSQSKARSQCCHAEGNDCIASGYNCHAEGFSTVASGENSHTEGFATIAQGPYQHAQGKYNIAQGRTNTTTIGASDLIHIVGNGTSNANRSNAHTLDWSGNAWFSGDVYVGSTSGKDKDAGSKKLATEEYVDGKIPAVTTDDNGKVMRVVDGAWSAEEMPTSSNVQSDWNQNDESAADYVKNRPFYTGSPVETVLLAETTLNVQSQQNGLSQFGVENVDFTFEIGKTYKVSWDGTMYSCVASDFNGSGIGCIGNQQIIGGADTGEPFIAAVDSNTFMIYTSDTATSHAVAISGYLPEIVKIDEKYLPDYLLKDPVYYDGNIANWSSDKKQQMYDDVVSGKNVIYIFGDDHIPLKVLDIGKGNLNSSIYFSGFYRNLFIFVDTDGTISGSEFPDGAIASKLYVDKKATGMDITSATVGQIARISAVDDNGVPTAWEAVDPEDVMIIKSSTPNSVKKFKITVDDSGAISATEVVE